MQYQVDFIEQAYALLPPFIRKTKMWQFLTLPIWSLQLLYLQFSNLRYETLYQLKYNGQKIALQQILNERFSYGGANIYIEDYEDVLPRNYIYLTSEVSQTSQLYLWTSQEIEGEVDNATPVHLLSTADYNAVPDFIIYINQWLYDVIDADNRMSYFESTINRRKMAGKKYTIQTY
jgi:hypothetical protein